MNIFLMFIILIIGLFVTGLFDKKGIPDNPDAKCPDGTTAYMYDDNETLCYFVTGTKGNESRLKEECSNIHQGGQLALVPDEGAMVALSGSSINLNPFDIYLIGVGDADQENEFRNSDGDIQEFFKWHSGEPDDSDHSQNCVFILNFDNKWLWADIPCYEELAAVCSVRAS